MYRLVTGGLDGTLQADRWCESLLCHNFANYQQLALVYLSH